jgi:hypothetical protein
MLTVNAFPINASCSFEVYPSAILGASFKGAKILDILSADTAGKLGFDPAAMHASVYPTLPAGTPNDYRAYSYVRFQLASGQATIIGIPWIRDESLVISTNRTVQLTIDDINDTQLNTILLALSANGFAAVDVKYPNG